MSGFFTALFSAFERWFVPSRHARLRNRINANLDLQARLEPSTAREALSDHIAKQVGQLILVEAPSLELKREWGDALATLLVTAMFAVPAYVAWTAGGWWRLILIPTLPMCLGGIGVAIDRVRGKPKVDREAKKSARQAKNAPRR